MIFTDYYKAQKQTEAKFRFDVTHSTGSYNEFEILLINKRGYNVSGLSFNYLPRPTAFGGNSERVGEMAITKNSRNISTVFIPNIQKHLIGYGDVQGTKDAIILLFSNDYNTIEVFVARGYKNDVQALYTEFCNGDFDNEVEALRNKAKDVLKNDKLPI